MSNMVPDDAPKPRASHLRKWTDFNGYGFNLHAEKGKAGQFIGKVDPDSPAESAGLKPGDRIVEVNDTNIGNENHQQVVGRIKAGYNGSMDETKLLVVDQETDQFYKSKKIVIRGDMPNVVGLATPPTRGGETIVTVSNGHIAEPEPEPVVTETVTTVTETVVTEAQVPYDRPPTPETIDEVTYDEPEPYKEPEQDDNYENAQREYEAEFIPPPPPAHTESEEEEDHTFVVQTQELSVRDSPADAPTYDEPEPTEEDVVAQFDMGSEDNEDEVEQKPTYDEEEENNNYEEVEVNKEPEPVVTETEVAVAAVAVAAAAEAPRDPTPPPREPTPPPREPTPPPVVVQTTETTVVTTTTVNGTSEPEPTPEPKSPIDPATGLELNVSVAEMKERLSSRRKRDSRNAGLNFKDKYDMFQRL